MKGRMMSEHRDFALKLLQKCLAPIPAGDVAYVGSVLRERHLMLKQAVQEIEYEEDRSIGDRLAGIDLAGLTLAELERRCIADTLARTNGNREKAAKMLGIGERTLYRKIERYGLEKQSLKGAKPQ